MKRYVIIGSGSGIGAEIARSLAGPEVALLLHTGSNAERLGGVAQTCREAGAEVSTCLGLTEDAALFDAVAQWAAPLADGAPRWPRWSLSCCRNLQAMSPDRVST